MLLIDADAVGRLRDLLMSTMGERAARAVLSHYGYTNGYYDAIKLQKLYPWDSELDWVAAGPVIHTLEGIVKVVPDKLHFDREKREIDMYGAWENSYEAAQHLATQGKASEPVCWTQSAYASGYVTAFFGHDCICVEEKCVAKGDDQCYWHIRTKDEWGPEAAPYIESLELLTTRRDDFRQLLKNAAE